jgi:hypothetical protein
MEFIGALILSQMFREWFFGEILGGVTWPNDSIHDSQRGHFMWE